MARKPGLGKGLGALIPEGPATEVAVESSATVTTSAGPLRRVPVDAITPNQFQPRKAFDEESLKALALSVAELGVLQPIIVRPLAGEGERYELIAGERRWRAAKMAELTTVPVLVQDDVNDLLSLEQAVVENLHRVDLHALEEAAAYQQLIQEFAMTHEQVAQRVGKSRTYITNTLRLLQLGEAAQNALANGQISPGHAKVILGITDHDAQATMVARVIKNEMSVRALDEAVKLFLEPRPTGTNAPGKAPVPGGKPTLRPVPDASVAELERLLEDYLDTRVHVDLKGRNGRVIIDFADLDDLERIYTEIVAPRK
jgi:ParB family transcriptional regulator, chromosome partitioning protein